MDRGSVVAEGTAEELARDDRVRQAYLGGGTTSSNAVTGGAQGAGGTATKEEP
jgi:hypothetical protein